MWAWLRSGPSQLRVEHNRVLRLIRQHQLLSPYRRRQREPETHDRTITTEVPNVMWGTDGTQVLTVEDGYAWVFSAVEHWNGECVGMYVCKRGTRHSAVQPVLEGVQAIYGSVARGVATGLAVRLDHGSDNCSERFNRTLKEQANCGKVFRTLDEVREAVLSFRQDYNRSWQLEKLGFLTPREARQRYEERSRLAAA